MMRFESWKNSFSAWSTRLSKNRHFKYGAPFIGIILCGVTVVSRLAQVRYDAKKVKFITDAEIDKIEKETGGKIRRRPAEERTPEAIHAEYMKKEFVQDYECVRGPRPWEESDKESEWETNRRTNPRIPRPVKSKGSYNL